MALLGIIGGTGSNLSGVSWELSHVFFRLALVFVCHVNAQWPMPPQYTSFVACAFV